MKIKDFFHRQRFTLMIIHNSGKSARQIRLNFVVIYVLLTVAIALNLFLIASLVFNAHRASELDNSNAKLSVSLQIEQDKNRNLQNIVKSSNSQIETLKGSLASNAEITEERLKLINETEKELNGLIRIFNEQTHSDLASPIASRSSSSEDRTYQGEDTEEAVIRIAKTLATDDEISSLLLEKQDSFKQFKDVVNEQLDYLETRPDFYPTYGFVSSGFGYRSDPATGAIVMHNGVDIVNNTGTEIYAAGTGYVIYSGYRPSYGYTVMIDHGYGHRTVYAHLSEIYVEEGDSVKKGELIALMGSSGYSTGSHLHFEIRYNDIPFDPLTMLNPQQ